MESPKFLRKYKTQLVIFKYVLGFIIVLYLSSLCTYLINSADTVSCIFGMLMQVSIVLLVITILHNDVKKFVKKLVK